MWFPEPPILSPIPKPFDSPQSTENKPPTLAEAAEMFLPDLK